MKMPLLFDPIKTMIYEKIYMREGRLGLDKLLSKATRQDTQNSSNDSRTHCARWISKLDGISEQELRRLSKKLTTSIQSYSKKMKERKVTNRDLSKYQNCFSLSEEDLKTLHQKRLCLIGGGYSPIKSGLKEKTFNVKS